MDKDILSRMGDEPHAWRLLTRVARHLLPQEMASRRSCTCDRRSGTSAAMPAAQTGHRSAGALCPCCRAWWLPAWM